MTLGNLLLAAERLGFKAAEVKPDAVALTQMPPPFLVLGGRPGEGWLAEARIGDHLVLQDLEAGRAAAHHVETVADLAAARGPAQAAAGAGRPAPVAGYDHAPAEPGALGARPRLGRDQPARPGDADLPDDRLQQGDQPRRAADPGRAGARHDHPVRVRVAAALAARLYREPHRRPARRRARQRGDPPSGAPAAAHLRGGADRPDPRAHAPARPAAPVLHEPDAAAAGRPAVRRGVRGGAVLSGCAHGRDRARRDAPVLAALDARPRDPPAARGGRLHGRRGQGVDPRRDGQPGGHGQGARARAGDGAALQGAARRGRLDRVSG